MKVYVLGVSDDPQGGSWVDSVYRREQDAVDRGELVTKDNNGLAYAIGEFELE